MMKIIKFLSYFIFMILLLIMCLILLLTWKMPINNFNLWRLKRNFEAASNFHPVQSQLLVKVAEFGNFGQSNHCDYLVGEFRATQLSQEELEKRYASLFINSSDKTQPIPLEIYFADQEVFQESPWSEWLSAHLPEPPLFSTEKIYLAFASIDGYSPDGDIRCH